MTTILITGVSRGIGRAMALEALSRGHKVIGTARSDDDFGDLKDRDGFTPLVLDVTSRDALAKAAGALSQPVDILINNAGIKGPSGSPLSVDDMDGFMQTLQVNALGPLMVTQAFLPALKKSGAGKVLIVSSQMGDLNADTGNIAYRTSKTAVNKIGRALATELRDDGIAVANLHPGWVRTDMGGSSADITPEESAKGIIDLAEGLTIDKTGRFWNWDGSERESW
ncbi:SDR family oxidoreductase [Notoacmeibacter sp. MSK16QG-6]|uniref:SDR family oxidoreductase n=1 Tax=Notoacmeibacter sp. MSK16QG-6 TaxID=2957982 RepID=UPI00209DE149|nr:SDR family oxidoreductase [Notoacmeibacter sp. MSK16QG-6]MCP1199731.1 SDR family oxidoreductase [Notoacmeibacter sp. MSK16QG-6]